MDLLTFENLVTLGMLILLQAVLGFDNLLYISLESKRAPADKQATVRRWGIGIAIVLRLILLFTVLKVIEAFTDPLFSINIKGVITGTFNLHALIELLGGVFIIYTAVKEIMHMMSFDDINDAERQPSSVFKIVAWIVMMNLVFSFDSILSAMALTTVFPIMATAIVVSGILMIWLADTVSAFLEKNRMYEVLGLFILFVVGIMLLSEGGHIAHMSLFGSDIMPMTKSTFYFVIIVLILVDIVQSRYQKKLSLLREARLKRQKAAERYMETATPVVEKLASSER